MRSETKTFLILMLLIGSIFFPIITLVRGIDTHSLTVTLDNLYFQNHLESNTTTNLTITIRNNGDVTEQNINLQLLINDSQPLNTTIDQLAPQKTYSSIYHWTPRDGDGLYNLTAYVFTSFANESETKWVNVCKGSFPQPVFTVWPISASNTVTKDANITFDASDSANPDGASIILYSWNFGNLKREEDNFSTTYFSFPSAGSFTVTLTVYDSDGASNYTSQTIDVTADPTAEPTIWNPPECKPPLDRNPYYVNKQLRFDGSGSTPAPDATIKSYFWSFGDNNTGTQKTMFHKYSKPDNYMVMLNVTDTNGRKGWKSLNISVIVGSPVANFTISPGPYYVNNEISFDASASYDPDNYNSSNAGIANYTWDFGDKSTETGQKVPHRYRSADNYNVTLTVSDYDNLASSPTVEHLNVTSQILVTIEDASTGNYTDISREPGETFTANVRVTNVEGLDYYSFTLDCPSSTPFTLLTPSNLTGDFPLNLTEFRISGSLCQITVASNQNLGRVNGDFTLATIPFNVTCPGNYTLRLSSWCLLNSLGNRIPIVLPMLGPNFYTKKPVALFWVDRNTPAPTYPVTFNASDSYDPQHASDYHYGITHYRWDFGDRNITDTNKTSTVQHSYMTDGEYNVTLTVWDSQGEQSSFTLPKPISVSEKRDVAVTGLTIGAADISNANYAVTLFNITVSLANNGNVNETFNVMVYDNNSYAANVTISIPLQSQTDAVFYNSTGWNVTGLTGVYTICANASVTDTVLSDNAKIKTGITLGKPCDLDGSGKAGLIELATLAKAYGSRRGDPNWDPCVDFNGDGKVNLDDLAKLSQNYGKDP